MKTVVKFRTHIPSFADGEPAPVREFANVAEILASLEPRKEAGEQKFHRWSASSNYIMGEWDNGTRWWVMGYTDADLSDLPKWKPVYVAMIDGVRTLLEDGEVRSSCGDYLTLYDGRVVRDARR